MEKLLIKANNNKNKKVNDGQLSYWQEILRHLNRKKVQQL